GTPAAGTAIAYHLPLTASNGVFQTTTQDLTLTVYAPGRVPIASSATFVTKDDNTKGKWQGVYGADGYSLSNIANQSIPAYASFALQNQNSYTWVTGTADTRALLIPNSAGRIASTWFNNVSFTLD